MQAQKGKGYVGFTAIATAKAAVEWASNESDLPVAAAHNQNAHGWSIWK
jgi:hypothetical protein